MATTNVIIRLAPKDFLPPQGGSYAVLGQANNGAWSLTFPDGIASYALAQVFLPDTYSGGTGMTFKLFQAGYGTGNVRWQVEVMDIADDGAGFNVDTNGFAAAKAGTLALSATSGRAKSGTIALLTAEADSAAAGRWALVRISRLGADALDTAAVDVQLLGLSATDT